MSDRQKRLYEELDVAANIIHSAPHGHIDILADLVADLTGVNSDSAFNPDAANAARATALRWLRDHGYLERTPRGYRAPRSAKSDV